MKSFDLLCFQYIMILVIKFDIYFINVQDGRPIIHSTCVLRIHHVYPLRIPIFLDTYLVRQLPY